MKKSKNEKLDILFIGTALIDSIIKGFDPKPISASGYRAESGSLCIGGEAVNGAITAAKLKMNTGILCSLGQDNAGDMIINELGNHGVITDHIIRSREYPTPVTTMFVSEDGSRKSITNHSHMYNFHPEQYPQILKNAKAIVLGSLFRAPFNEPEVIKSVLNMVKKENTLIFADTKLPNFKILSLDDIKESLPIIDYITPNEDEAKYYTGKTNPAEMADVFLSYGIKNVIIKLGEKGCFFKNRERSICLKAYNIDAKDATGAGDSFVAGFASDLLLNNNIDSALRFANACGAICTTAIGAGTALKSRDQVLRFIKDADNHYN